MMEVVFIANPQLDVTFPRMPCGWLSLDVMDVSGELELDVDHDIFRKRLSGDGRPLDDGEKHEVRVCGVAPKLPGRDAWSSTMETSGSDDYAAASSVVVEHMAPHAHTPRALPVCTGRVEAGAGASGGRQWHGVLRLMLRRAAGRAPVLQHVRRGARPMPPHVTATPGASSRWRRGGMCTMSITVYAGAFVRIAIEWVTLDAQQLHNQQHPPLAPPVQHLRRL